tara:strand:+ start:793 stop:1116 length:324 start_codon:yes stop_codon:yes gene_type:complete
LIDEKCRYCFYARADAHIFLSNEQISPAVKPGEVSASFMYSVARFNAWISARGFNSGVEMQQSKQKMIDYFLAEYRQMREENLDDYSKNFDSHMQPIQQWKRLELGC